MQSRFKKIKIFKLFIALAVAISGLFYVTSCKKKTENYTSPGAEFYNYAPGDVRDYWVDSQAYEWTSGNLLKYHFLLREKVMDTFTDLAGNLALRVEQYLSRDTGRSYQFYKLQSIVIDKYGMQKVEDNQRYVKMSIPIKLKRKWDGNIYNDLGAKEYKYTGVGVSYANDFLASKDCVEVTQQDDSTLISRDLQQEVYGKNFGLFYKYAKSIQYNGSGQPQGYIITWKLKAFNK